MEEAERLALAIKGKLICPIMRKAPETFCPKGQLCCLLCEFFKSGLCSHPDFDPKTSITACSGNYKNQDECPRLNSLEENETYCKTD